VARAIVLIATLGGLLLPAQTQTLPGRPGQPTGQLPASRIPSTTGEAESAPPKHRQAPGFRSHTTFAERLAAAKAVEEGDGDLARALEEYRELLAEFDEQRGAIAEALFRSGELARKLGRQEEARLAYARVLREFTDQGEVARLSLQRMTGLPAVTAGVTTGLAPGSGAEQYGRSPLTIDATTPARYGADAGAGIGKGGGGGFGPTPAVRGRYGLNVPVIDERNLIRLQNLEKDLSTLRNEARELSAEQRQVEREQRAAASSEDDPRNLPLRFVRDPELTQMIARLEQLRQTPAEGAQKEEWQRLLRHQQESLLDYFRNTYLKRLEKTHSVLEKELQRLQHEIQVVEKELENVREEATAAAAKAAETANARR
jgi:hypothetical protein